jgi:hypothetical protein
MQAPPGRNRSGDEPPTMAELHGECCEMSSVAGWGAAVDNDLANVDKRLIFLPHHVDTSPGNGCRRAAYTPHDGGENSARV